MLSSLRVGARSDMRSRQAESCHTKRILKSSISVPQSCNVICTAKEEKNICETRKFTHDLIKLRSIVVKWSTY